MKRFLLFYKIVLILIFLFLAQYLILKGEYEVYRFSDKQYLYEYGKQFSKGLVYVGLILSILYPLIVWLKEKKEFMKNIVWVIIGFMPALYYILLFVLSYESN